MWLATDRQEWTHTSVTPGGDAPRLRASSTEADRRPDVGGDGSAPRCWGSAGAAVGRPITEVRVAALNRDDDEVGRPLGSSTTSVWPAARSISTRGIPTMSTVDEEMGAGQRRAGLENRQQVRTTVEEEERRSVRAYPPDQGLHLDRFLPSGERRRALKGGRADSESGRTRWPRGSSGLPAMAARARRSISSIHSTSVRRSLGTSGSRLASSSATTRARSSGAQLQGFAEDPIHRCSHRGHPCFETLGSTIAHQRTGV